MSSCGTPCGACKFLRRKCVRGCVFAPYFCHEQGCTQFAAIHKVFGASNVAKHLRQLPVCDRSEAAATISYEAQARVHDPIYGCVSHIFALQQQVVSLQAQLATLKQHVTTTTTTNNSSSTSNPNPNEKQQHYGKATCSSSNNNYPQDVQSWLQSEYPQMMMPTYDPSLININNNRIVKSTMIHPNYQLGDDDDHGFIMNNNDHFHDCIMVQGDDQQVVSLLNNASFQGSSSHQFGNNYY